MAVNPFASFSIRGRTDEDEWTNPLIRTIGTQEPTIQTISEAPTTNVYRNIVEGLSPEDISGAYESSYGRMLADPNAFRVSPQASAEYFNRLESKLTGEGLESIGGELAARGYAPQGGGTMAQLYGQLRQNIGLQRAGAELGLEQEAVGRQGQLRSQGAAQLYAALTGRRRTTTTDQTTTPGIRTMTTTPGRQTQARYGAGGTYAIPSVGGFRMTPSAGGGVQSKPWWLTSYGEMNALIPKMNVALPGSPPPSPRPQLGGNPYPPGSPEYDAYEAESIRAKNPYSGILPYEPSVWT